MSSERLDILRIMRRRAGLIALTTVVAAVGAFLVTVLQAEEYLAGAEVLLETVPLEEQVIPRDAIPSFDRNQEALTDIQLFTTSEVAEATAADVDGRIDPDDLEDVVEVTKANGSNVIEVEATVDDPALAASVANSVAENYIEFRRQLERERIRRAIELVREDLEALGEGGRRGGAGEALREQLIELTALRALQTGGARILREAEISSSPVSSSPLVNGIFGGVLGLIIGAGLAFLLDRVDRRLKTADQLESSFELPLLARIPESRALLGAAPLSLPALFPADREAFEMLRSRLRYFNVDRPLGSILVTSPAAGDGKTTVAAYLAATVASAGESALLVEADMRSPSIAQRLEGSAGGPGLAELLSGQVELDEVIRQAPVDGAGASMAVITAGALPPNPAQLLGAERASSLLEELGVRYSMVIVDAPPITAVADAIPLIREVDGVIVVGRIGLTTGERVKQLNEQLSGLDAEALGAVANGVPEDDRVPPYGGTRA